MKSLHINHVSSLHSTSLHLFTLHLQFNSLACNYILNPLSQCVWFTGERRQYTYRKLFCSTVNEPHARHLKGQHNVHTRHKGSLFHRSFLNDDANPNAKFIWVFCVVLPGWCSTLSSVWADNSQTTQSNVSLASDRNSDHTHTHTHTHTHIQTHTPHNQTRTVAMLTRVYECVPHRQRTR